MKSVLYSFMDGGLPYILNLICGLPTMDQVTKGASRFVILRFCVQIQKGHDIFKTD